MAARWAPIAAARGAVVIDNSSALAATPTSRWWSPRSTRADPQPAQGIIANPGATTLTMIDALGVLHGGWELTELVVATYQAASGAGPRRHGPAHDELEVVAGHRELGTSRATCGG